MPSLTFFPNYYAIHSVFYNYETSSWWKTLSLKNLTKFMINTASFALRFLKHLSMGVNELFLKLLEKAPTNIFPK